MNNETVALLYVEDNPSDIETVRRHLNKIDEIEADLDEAHTADDAHERLEEETYDIVMIDYRLSGENGLEFLEQLNRRNERIATIMLTGKGSEQLAAKSMRRGANDYLSKSDLSPSTLRYSINFVLKQIEEKNDRQEKISELQKKAELDELTGLHNRRALEERLNEETKRASRYGNALCLMMIDLDQFKPINDRYGHVTGDDVLKKTGEVILNITRESDYSARYGGDEFCVLSPQTHVNKAKTLADRLRRTLKERLPEQLSGDEELTCSIGITEYHNSIDSPRTLIHEADKAMYTAKEMGGDQIFIINDNPNNGKQTA